MVTKSWFARLALAAALGLPAGMSAPAPVSASSSCSGAGYLCFYDNETNNYGNVEGTNPDWRDFGWNDRADLFKNDGRTHNACVYENIEYNKNPGGRWYIPRNATWYSVLANKISSNDWTMGQSVTDCTIWV